MTSFRNDEFSTASHDVKRLKTAKESLYLNGFPEAETRGLVSRFFQREKFGHLVENGLPLVYLVAPSTTGENTLPRHFASRLQDEFGGQIVVDWARPLAIERAAKKGALGKIREPARYEINRTALVDLPANSRLVLVDDVVTTGQSLGAMREALARERLSISEVLSLAQSELRKISVSDTNRMVSKLGEEYRQAVQAVFSVYSLKHYANYIERITPRLSDNSKQANETRELLRAHFETESKRLREIGRFDPRAIGRTAGSLDLASSVQPGQGTSSRISAGLPAKTSSVRGGTDDTENQYPKDVMKTDIQSRELGNKKTASLADLTVIEAYEINGVPSEVLERFSKRSKAVESAATQFKTANSGREPTTAELTVIKRETREATAFTERFMKASEGWEGGDKRPLLDYLAQDIDKVAKSALGRSQLLTLGANYLDGQVPHFGQAAAQILALERVEQGTLTTAKEVVGRSQAVVLDETHRRHLMERIHDLKDEYSRETTEVGRKSVLERAAGAASAHIRAEGSSDSSQGVKLRRAVKEFVEGKVDATKVSERIASYRAAVSNAVLAERESQSQTNAIKP